MRRITAPEARAIAETMEDRILHSADVAPLALAGAASDTLAQQSLLAPTTDAEVQRSEIVFVDAGVPDAETLIADLLAQRDAGRPIQIVRIGAGQDGIALISDTLAGRSDVTAVHVLAHGSDGRLQLGAATLDAQALMQRAGEIAGWSAALTADADLLLYGCDVAQTALGRQFVSDLAALTGADVAASTDLTGAATMGGNWVLEFGTGRIEATAAIDAVMQQRWAGTLAVGLTSQSSGGTSSSTTSYDFSHNVNSGSDRLLLVELVIANGVDASAVSYNGSALTLLARQDSPTGHVGVELWYLVAPQVGSNTVSVTLASASTLVVGATSYAGVSQTTPFGTPVTAAGSTGVPLSFVNADAGDLVVDIVGAKGVSGNVLGPGQTQNFVENQGIGVTDLFGVSSREAGTGSVGMSHAFTSADGNWASIAVKINQASTTAVVSTAQDTYIDNGSTTNYGASTSLVVDRSGGSDLGNQRALLQFDFSAIPAGATITSASLQMQATANGGAFNINVHRLTEAWVQGSANGAAGVANWNERSPGANWTTSGGTYDPTAVATLNTGAVGQHSWNLTSLVQAWVAGTTANHGIIIGSPDTGTTTITYDSSEGTTPPRLVITYTLANLAPAVTATGSPQAYVENQAATAIDPGLTVNDADSPTLAGATVSISANYANGQDVLAFTDQLGITGNWNAGTGVLTLSGAASVADYQTALRSVTYFNSSDNPSTLTRTVSFVVDDGVASSNLATRNIGVTSVNDAPAITSNGGGASAAVNVAENTTLVTTVVATDADGTTPVYSIVGGADAARFAIDASTGVLRFIVPPNFEAPTDVGANNVYDVIVRASDGSLFADQAIAVTVGNVTEALLTTGEQGVNTVTSGTQETSAADRGSPRAVAISPAGDYVVVWSSQNQDGSGWGVYGQRYDQTGAKLGGEIAVNQFVAGDQVWATVAMDVSGRFVVSWTSANQDGTLQSVYARLFHANGSANGGEFRVNTTATGSQFNSSVAMDANGNFVVVWQGNGPGDADGIFGRRFQADGTALDATEFRINTDLGRAHYDASVSMNASGAFAVTWDNNAGVQLRRYGSNGVALGGEINASGGLSAGNGSIALADDGTLAVVWRDTVIDKGVYLQRYNSAGAPVGLTTLVNTTTLLGDQTDPSIAMDGAGNFIVAWEGNGSGDTDGVFAQKFTSAGVAVGGEFRLNSTVTGNQSMVSLAILDLNNFVAVWSGQSAGDGAGVLARQYGTFSFAPVITSHGGAEDVALNVAENGTAVTTVTATDADLPAQTLTYSISGVDAARFTIGSGSGVLSFAPAPDFENALDVGADNVYNVTVHVSDGTLSASQSFAITVTNVNDVAPVAATASATGPEDTLLPITLSATDVDSGVASFTVSALPANGTLYLDAARSTAIVAGNAYAASGNALTLYFDPAANWNGSSGFNFVATDTGGLTSVSASAGLTVTPVNDAPLAAPASASGPEDSLLPITLSGSDVDGSVASFTVAALPANGTLYLDAARTTPVLAGNAYAASGNALTLYFDPAADWNGGTAFNFVATDSLGLSGAAASASLTITAVNDAPVAAASSAIGMEDTLLPITLTGSDVDGTVASFTVSGLPTTGTLYLDAARTVPVIAGNAVAASGNALTLYFDPAPNWNGNTGFTFVATDNLGLDSVAAAASLTITPVNDAPVAAGASAVGAEDTLLPVTLSASDVDGTIASFTVSALPANGTLYLDAARSTPVLAGTAYAASGNALTLYFEPALNWNGLTGFNFIATDDLGLSSVAVAARLTVTPVNDVPLLAAPVADQGAMQGVGFSFSLPTGSFTDVDAGDSLSYTATLASGGALPGWLSFNAATQTFSGTPGNADVGALVVRVTATDQSNASVVGDFNLTVTNVNDAPVLATPIADQAATQGVPFSFGVPAGSFTDADAGDTLSYSATLASGAALPGWLSFNAATQTFTGTPGNADVGVLVVRVTATDTANASVFGDFNLSVVNVNDAPVLAAPIADRTAQTQQVIQFQIPAATFTDVDVGDNLRYVATLANGSALPAWLAFDAATRTFSGTPATADVGLVLLRVTAIDDAGAAAQGLFAITVFEPEVAAPPAAPAPAPAPAASGQVIVLAVPDQVEDTPAPQRRDEVVAAPPVASSSGPVQPLAVALGSGATAPQFDSSAVGTVAAPEAGMQARAVIEVTAGQAASRADTVLADAFVHQFNTITLAPMLQMLQSDEMLRKLEEIKRQLLEQGEAHRSAVASTIAVTSGLSIGYVVWLVRGGVLVSSMLSALPAWQMIDPLPVLAATGALKRGRAGAAAGDDGDVERLFDKKTKATPLPPSAPPPPTPGAAVPKPMEPAP